MIDRLERRLGRGTAALQRLMLRTHRTPLAVVWRAIHAVFIGALVVHFRWRTRGAAVYLSGSFGTDEPVYGLSDVDLVVVTPTESPDGGPRYQLGWRRWHRLRRHGLLVRRIVTVSVYHDTSLRDAVASPCLTYGLEKGAGERDGACLLTAARHGKDNLGLRLRPKLPVPMADWRLVAGADRRPRLPAPSLQRQRIAAWLELQCWWRRAFAACADPESILVPYLCLKLFAESARVWLLVGHRQEALTRTGVLDLAAKLMREEAECLGVARDLARALPRQPDPPLHDAVEFLRRTTSRVAQQFEQDVEVAGETEVALTGGAGHHVPGRGRLDASHLAENQSPDRLRILDWRALVAPRAAEEWAAVTHEDALDTVRIGQLARHSDQEDLPAVFTDRLLLLPTDREKDALLRAVQCHVTDPVTFALCDGRAAARYPNVEGWSAQHTARRAVAEHRGWLRQQAGGMPPTTLSLTLLFTAARAALFLESLESSRPSLMLSAGAVAEALGSDNRRASRAAQDALAAYALSRIDGREPPTLVCESFGKVVADLPAYRGEAPARAEIA
jgi:hypothetical protein